MENPYLTEAEAAHRAAFEVSAGARMRGASRALMQAYQRDLPGLLAGRVDVGALARVRTAERLAQHALDDALGEASPFRPENRAQGERAAARRLSTIF